jgi:hypothetical protein
MASPAVQALERAVAREVGWPLFDMKRRGAELGDGRTELVVEETSGESVVWEAVVSVGREVPMPNCGISMELATKTEQQLVVGCLQRR